MGDSRGKALRALRSVDAVVDALGGTVAVQRLTGKRWAQSITNARSKGRFPPDTFLILTDALRAIGCSAPPELWGIRPAAQAARG